MSVRAISSTSDDQVNLRQQQAPPTARKTGQTTFLPTPKQIRFVPTDGQPHAKRRRINAACLTCRKRKTRCSGEQPECKTCVDTGQRCAGYTDKARRRDGDRRGREDDEDVNDNDDDDHASGSSSPDKLSHEPDLKNKSWGRPWPSSEPHTAVQADARSQPGRPAPVVDVRSPASAHTASSTAAPAARTRLPYFRYFGPTAIVPGFKQMVVQMKDGRDHPWHRRSHASLPSEASAHSASGGGAPAQAEEVSTPPLIELPYYDAADTAPNDPLITGLCEVFFVHLACNYPFLQRERFMKDLKDKRVDAILVNAVCAVAARFAPDEILTKPSDGSLPLDAHGYVKRAFRGQPFAQRAMSAVIEMFPYPTMAVTQACLLLAYEEFGSDRDSGLWMFLGTAIRMAQDQGIQKLEGLQLEGRIGPTPKTTKRGDEGKMEEQRRANQQRRLTESVRLKENGLTDDRRASEQERIDTFWSIFFLDRAVSSGVGRPVTLRDKDIEISFPYKVLPNTDDVYAQPFPAMLRIVHMYGRVADVINNIKDIDHVTVDVLRRLTEMERDLTGMYQRMSSKLDFNATNFQHYVKHGQGTNFILLHFWFHTLIVLLHQPTLLHSFEGRIQQLFPDSRELSISSAKTIADILAFAELIDVKSFIGNPFTSQPMYVAACAFLAEAAMHASQPPSRHESPQDKGHSSLATRQHPDKTRDVDQKTAAKHSLLAAAANQNYQRCYKALQLLNTYWAGCRYILTALDQKSKGLMDPLLFTSDDVDEMPSTEPSFTSPGWRRMSFGVSLGGAVSDRSRIRRGSSQDVPWSPEADFANAIGWSLTGSGNSPAPNFSVLYRHAANDPEARAKPLAAPPRRCAVPLQNSDSTETVHPQRPVQATIEPPRAHVSSLPYDPVSTAEADLLLGLHSPYSISTTAPPAATSHPVPSPATNPIYSQTYNYGPSPGGPPPSFAQSQLSYYPGVGTPNYTDMLIESQEIDMSSQSTMNFGHLSFPGGDMIPWLEYLPQDVLDYFGEPNDMAAPETGMANGAGPLSGPPNRPSSHGLGDHSSTGQR